MNWNTMLFRLYLPTMVANRKNSHVSDWQKL